MNYNCLIIDDEKLLADATAEYFNMLGVSTAATYSSGDCLNFLASNTVDVILLDINLGDGSGFTLCKKIRQFADLPILFISARTSDDDQVIALNIGGDDYIQKPYSLAVLFAKVKAVLKRCGSAEKKQWSDDRLKIDFTAKTVAINGNLVKLKAMEYRLLSYLVENQGHTIEKQELFEKVWGDTFTGDGTLNVHIRRLREVIEVDPSNPKYIITVWGGGYKFTEDIK